MEKQIAGIESDIWTECENHRTPTKHWGLFVKALSTATYKIFPFEAKDRTDKDLVKQRCELLARGVHAAAGRRQQRRELVHDSARVGPPVSAIPPTSKTELEAARGQSHRRNVASLAVSSIP